MATAVDADDRGGHANGEFAEEAITFPEGQRVKSLACFPEWKPRALRNGDQGIVIDTDLSREDGFLVDFGEGLTGWVRPGHIQTVEANPTINIAPIKQEPPSYRQDFIPDFDATLSRELSALKARLTEVHHQHLRHCQRQSISSIPKKFSSDSLEHPATVVAKEATYKAAIRGRWQQHPTSKPCEPTEGSGYRPSCDDEWDTQSAQSASSASYVTCNISAASGSPQRAVAMATMGRLSGKSRCTQSATSDLSNILSNSGSGFKKSVWGSKARFSMHEAWSEKLIRVRRDRKDDSRASLHVNSMSAPESQATALHMSTGASRTFRILQKPARTQINFAGTTLIADHWDWLHCQFSLIHPASKFNVVWNVLAAALVLIDVIMIPVELSFEPVIEKAASQSWSYITAVFWTLTMALQFITSTYIDGRLMKTVRKVGRQYIRTWFIFDLSLLVPEWVVAISYDGDISRSTALSILPVLRTIRVSRFARLIRVAHSPLAQWEMMLTQRAPSLHLYTGLTRTLFLLVIGEHLVCCAWYRVGLASGGWVNSAGLDSADVITKYLAALQWSQALVHGTNFLQPNGAWERAFSTTFMLIGFVIFSLVAGQTYRVVASSSDEEERKMMKTCRRYIASHDISSKLALKMTKYIQTLQKQRIMGHCMKDEQALLSGLPHVLQMDLHYEARAPTSANYIFLAEVGTTNAHVLLQLCHVAMKDSLALREEIIYHVDTECNCMIFVFAGECYYTNKADMGPIKRRRIRQTQKVWSAHPSVGSHWGCVPEDLLSSQHVVRHGYTCEASLWTTWVHHGKFEAVTDSTMLLLDPEQFGTTIRLHTGAMLYAVKYVLKYIQCLNAAVDVSDLLRLHIPTQDLDDSLLDANDDGTHFMFLSHFKAEAGTEATMLKEKVEELIVGDISHPACDLVAPVFLDSEDLTDLSTLKEHVSKSLNLVVLLTPKILTRPWCLVEIATAFQCETQMVPVLVERPGISFKYPDEEYFQSLGTGAILTEDNITLLKSEGIALDLLEESVRELFKHIALSFSPHKAASIRSAEIERLMKRCLDE